jgi:hypothetical protein
MRKNDYYPDRIERYYADVFSGEMAWSGYSDEEGGSVLPWVDITGKPLGIAAIHFTNIGMRPEAIDAWSIQDQLLNSVIDFAANNRIAAFRVYKAFGWMPTTDGKAPAADGSNRVSISPGMIVGTHNQTGQHPPSFDVIEGSDSAPFIATIEANIRYASMLTDTPVERFQMTRQVASEGTQQAYNETLINKVEKRQTRFANAWSRVWMLALRMAETWGGLDALPDRTAIKTNWKPAYKRKLDEIIKESDAKSRAGIPQEMIWAETWGYTPDQIADMQKQPSYIRRRNIESAGLDVEDNG